MAVGYVKVGRDKKIEMDPDLRVREAIGLVFTRFAEMQSIRQVIFVTSRRSDRATLHQLQNFQDNISCCGSFPVYADGESIFLPTLFMPVLMLLVEQGSSG